MKRASHGPVVVAAGQLESRLMNEAATTLEAIDGLIAEAARQTARLLVLPECAYPAYLLGSAESYRAGEHLSSGQFVEWLSGRARETRLHIVCGYVEDTGAPAGPVPVAQARLYNSAVLLGPDGQILGRTRKQFLWHLDHEWFTPGGEIAAFDTELGRIGIIICAEARVPEIVATLVADGAEMIAVPTCWINASRQPGEYRNPQPEFMIEARAREFGLPFICADKAGLEMTMGYVGQSCVVNADGSMPVKAPTVGQALIVTEIVPAPAAPRPIEGSLRDRLLSADPPRSPGRSSPCNATIAAVSGASVGAMFAGDPGGWPFSSSADSGIRLLLADVPDEKRAGELARSARARGAHGLCRAARPEVVEVGSVRLGAIPGRLLSSFAAGRGLALDGAEVLIYFGAADDLPMLRTRAVENRVFVVGVDGDAGTIIAPDGTILSHGTPARPAVAAADLAEASNKLVAPRTDIFAQRRVETYRV